MIVAVAGPLIAAVSIVTDQEEQSAAAQALTTRPLVSLGLSVAFAVLVSWLGLGIAYFRTTRPMFEAKIIFSPEVTTMRGPQIRKRE